MLLVIILVAAFAVVTVAAAGGSDSVLNMYCSAIGPGQAEASASQIIDGSGDTVVVLKQKSDIRAAASFEKKAEEKTDAGNTSPKTGEMMIAALVCLILTASCVAVLDVKKIKE